MHTILVADDSLTIQRAVEIAFDKEPFRVVKAGSGTEAIAQALQLRPHLVLADHLMPDKTGYEVAEALRADPSTQAIPVLILSGSSAPFDENRAAGAGVVGHIAKPFDCQSLLERVRGLLGANGAAEAPGLPAARPLASTLPLPAGLPPPPGLPRPPPSLPRTPTPLMTPVAPAASAPAVMSWPSPSTPQPAPSALSVDPFAQLQQQSVGPNAAGSGFPATLFAAPASMVPSFAAPAFVAGSGGTPVVDELSPPGSPGSSTAAATTPPGLSSPPTWHAPRTWAEASAPAAKETTDVTMLEPADIISSASDEAPAVMTLAPAPATNAYEAPRHSDVPPTFEAPPAEPESSALPSTAEMYTAAVVEAAAPILATAGIASSRETLVEEARQIIERIAWEIIPELAESIIREEIQRLMKNR